ncbi:MAG: aldo/keto reductase, partial [Muribaculaceae bacterium]|nr:aldo/keto reductase [Muribaculaceae bacterium]
GKYIDGIPHGSRADKGSHLTKNHITPEIIAKIKKLGIIAAERGESLARMSAAWVLSQRGVTSIIAGCSATSQLDESISALDSPAFTKEQLEQINSAIK